MKLLRLQGAPPRVRAPVCTENLVRIETLMESRHAWGDDRADLPGPQPAGGTRQVQEPELERLPAVDLTHHDLSRGDSAPEQHGGGFGGGQHPVCVLISRLNSLRSGSISFVTGMKIELGSQIWTGRGRTAPGVDRASWLGCSTHPCSAPRGRDALHDGSGWTAWGHPGTGCAGRHRAAAPGF